MLPLIEAAASCALLRVRHAITTSWPAQASAVAVALPTPLFPPVTMIRTPARPPFGVLTHSNSKLFIALAEITCSSIPLRMLSEQASCVCDPGSLSAQQAPEPDTAARQAAAADCGPALGTYLGPDERVHTSQPGPKCHRGANMADDAVAPEGELSKSTTTEETSSAAEPASGGNKDAEAAQTQKATDGDEAGAADGDEDSVADFDAEAPDEEAPGEAAPAKPRMSHLKLATLVGLVVVVALAGLTGWLGFRTYQSRQADEQQKLFLQVGRQGALKLTTIDWQQADANVQRILDSATGTFYDDFQKRSQPFVEVVKQAQSKSVGTIAEAGLEPNSITDNGAQVLVAVMVKTSNTGAPDQQPRSWRMRISVQKVGNEAKVSNVEFVP